MEIRTYADSVKPDGIHATWHEQLGRGDIKTYAAALYRPPVPPPPPPPPPPPSTDPPATGGTS